MSEGPNQPRRYCTNCGAEIREGTSFCISCGAPLAAGEQEPPPPPPGPPPSEGPSPLDNLLLRVRSVFNRVRESLAGVDAGGIRRLPGRVTEWFRNLPSTPKLVIVGLVLLVLLILLSPIAVIICVLLLGVSIIALIVQVAQRRSVKNWAIVAVASVVLMVTFGEISDRVYGGGGNPSSGQGGSGEKNTDTPSGGGGASPSPSPSPSPSVSPSPSPSALAVGDETTITGEVFGYPEEFTYEGLYVSGQVIDVNGEHVMVMMDPMNSDAVVLGAPGTTVRVHGEYRGVISQSSGGSYEAVLADDVEMLDDQ